MEKFVDRQNLAHDRRLIAEEDAKQPPKNQSRRQASSLTTFA